MSIQGVTCHNENIVYMMYRPPVLPVVQLKYASMHKKRLIEEIRKNKHQHRTMGYAEVPLPDPKDFMKKGSRIVAPPPKHESPKCLTGHKNPPVPSRKELNLAYSSKKVKDEVNFKAMNVKNVMKMAPKSPEMLCVDTRFGDKICLKKAGLCPTYVYKKSFGKVPRSTYCKFMCDANNNQQESNANGKVNCRYISSEERDNLLTGLKENWTQLQSAFNKLPVLTDTLPKKARKAKMEAELKQLEKDILEVERHPHIYVYED